jgi:hypothetical protein
MSGGRCFESLDRVTVLLVTFGIVKAHTALNGVLIDAHFRIALEEPERDMGNGSLIAFLCR